MRRSSNKPTRKRQQLKIDKNNNDQIESNTRDSSFNLESATTIRESKKILSDNLTTESEANRSVMNLGYQMDNGKINDNSTDNIDYDLYSRQVYTLGKDVMINMSKTNVLVSGIDGLGVEIAKNLILGGFKSVDIHDTLNTSILDLSTQYYLNKDDVGRNRAKCCLQLLADLNNYVNVECYTMPITEEFFKSYSVVVLVNRPLILIKKCSNWARTYSVKLIIANTKGLIGQIFCDYGDKFVSNDPTGEEPLLLITSHVTNDGYVTMLDGKRHGLVDGDYVSFPYSDNCAKLIGKKISPPFEIKVITSDSFCIVEPIPNDIELAPGNCFKVAMPAQFEFLPFEEALINPKFVTSNFAKHDLIPILHISMIALLVYQQKFLSFPSPHNINDANEFIKIVHELNNSGNIYRIDKLDENLLTIIAMQSTGQLAAIQAIIGGITAQEVIKASSHKYTPINQWLYFDSLELINTDNWKNSDRHLFDISDVDISKFNFRSLGQIAIFGVKFQKIIEKSSVFIVGAGAIGCELLKNLALMGVACDQSDESTKNNAIYITDMDNIERSNLSRQFLFRNNDIGKMKSTTASSAALKINPYLCIKSFQLKVGEETENVFNSKFYNNINCILNALDNVDARRYMDGQSIAHTIPMIDGGTLGTLGNVQVVIPYITESYTSSTDPEETSIPVCTLKHFPYLIEHAIQWARDQFEGIFKNSPECSINFIKNKQFIEDTFNSSSFDYIEAIKNVYNIMVANRPHNFMDCVRLGRNLFEEIFVNSIEQLLFNLPPNHIGVFGQPFWLPPKKCPKPLNFDINDELHFNFVNSSAILTAYIYSIPINTNKNEIIEFLENYTTPQFKINRSSIIYENEEEEEKRLKSGENTTSQDEKALYDNQLNELKAIDFNTNPITIKSINFEKDDDTNYHMQFIYSCSNLRAKNYDIECADYHKTKLIAGKIIPAISTTTSVVAGLECIELYKVLLKFDNIELYQNSYLNLAISVVTGTEPFPPKFIQGVKGKFSFWDVIKINESNEDGSFMTISDLINSIRDRFNLGSVCMINYGKKLLYADFFKDKEERLNHYVRDAIMGKKQDHPITKLRKEFVMLDCLVEDLEGNDCEIPSIKFIFS